MSEIAVLYSLARSGGTLISKCLGCIPGNVLLSEINPRWAYFNPLNQAKFWFNLVSDQDIENLYNTGNYNYLGAIRLIHQRCTENDLNLVIRDWTHVDFTTGDYPVSPIYRLSQFETLKAEYSLRHIALVRHPLDTFLSLARLPDYRGRIGISEYLYGVRSYAEAAVSIGFVRFEDFCVDPNNGLQIICESLRVNYDRDYRDCFHRYRTVTGENYHPGQQFTLTGEAVGERNPTMIRLPPRREEFSEMRSRIVNNSDYKAIIEMLGYEY